MLAGIAVGIFTDPKDAVKKCTKAVTTVVPNPESTEKYAKLFQTYQKIHDVLAPIYRER